MTGAKKPGGANRRKGLAILATVVVVVVGCCVAGALNYDDSTVVPPPTATERADTVAILARAAQSQGFCYGWQLEDQHDDVVSVGSNLGDGVSVEDNPACPRWVRVNGNVHYAPMISNSSGYAFFSVSGPIGLSAKWRIEEVLSAERKIEERLERFGLTEDVLFDDPGWAVTRAAVTLPLLVAELGIAGPAPAATEAPATSPPALPDAGSDLWRDRWGYLLGVAGLLLLTALFVAIGLWQRHRQLGRRVEGRPASTAPRQPAGRTPERR
ncbi:hypothetical protein GA0070606_3094 [Micromonospora citrea]|uniref:Uncharacterized protein n=1 Tax=Micromonospora citrea TaxID=47855 RepID=A0A1C6V014_9ACTN|nr:hypothetical protein [Micromonospora citrea]SCL59400.1 hypothetical protein GA0070606_3094 [Micromonospora citrea]